MMSKEYLTYKLADTVKQSAKIDNDLFTKNHVKRGLRNEDGSGVLVGLTRVGNVVGYERDKDGKIIPIPGHLVYRGYDVEDLVRHEQAEDRFGFEEIAYLLLSGNLPDAEELENFHDLLIERMPLPHEATMSILSRRGLNIMNILARSVLELYIHDPNPDDLSRENSMRQAIDLIARFPTIVAYAWNAYRHAQYGKPMHVRLPNSDFSFAENFLYMMHRDYTPLEARVLDLALILHAEHGGGNNSTFTVRVTSSTRTDIYSSIAAGIGSLKGPLHGGANIRVVGMMDYLKDSVHDWKNVDELDTQIMRILNKEAYDHTGLVYGIGHAVYTKSDPRAVLIRELASKLAAEKGRLDEFRFQELVEQRAIENFRKLKGPNAKTVCANVDFYTGFVYDLLGLPQEIYTPLFAISRIVGWCAHRIEELNFSGRRIIRPAYWNVEEDAKEYVPLAER
jgi:citrate synthase